jgi:hypothetical protein
LRYALVRQGALHIKNRRADIDYAIAELVRQLARVSCLRRACGGDDLSMQQFAEFRIFAQFPEHDRPRFDRLGDSQIDPGKTVGAGALGRQIKSVVGNRANHWFIANLPGIIGG